MNAQHSNFKILSLIITSGVFIPFFFMPPYWDDIYRHAFKYMGLFDQGRYLLEAYYWVLIGEVATFPAAIGIFNVLACFTMIYFACIKFSASLDKNTNHASIIGATLLLGSPFILENLSYQVDNIGMFAALSLSLYSSSTLNDRLDRFFFIRTAILILASFFYQASFNIFLVSSLIFIALNAKCSPALVKMLISIVATLLVTITVVMILANNFAIDPYVKIHTTPVPLSIDGVKIVSSNIDAAYHLFSDSLSFLQKIIVIVFTAVTIIFSTVHAFRLFRKKECLLSIFIFLMPFLLITLQFFPYVLFTSPIIQPRVFLTFGLFMTYCFYSLPRVNAWRRFAEIIGALFLIVNSMTASGYVAAINSNYSAISSYYNSFQNDIRYSLNDNSRAIIYVNGSMPTPSIQSNNENYFPIIKKLIRNTLSGWAAPGFMKLNNIDLQFKYMEITSDFKPALDRSDYKIFKKDGESKYIVKFK